MSKPPEHMGQDRELRGRTALITGAVRRIGRAMALALADEGANIVVHARSSEEKARLLCDELEQKGVKSYPMVAELEREEEYGTLIERSINAAGPLDILINNASMIHSGEIWRVDFESLSKHIKVNAWAPFALSRDFARLAKKGKIINLLDSGISGYDFGHVAYILSKHVLWVLTKMTAVQFAPDITVNGISPGLILPPASKDVSSLFPARVNRVPLKRRGTPEDIARAAVYLAKSNYMTGEVMNVDGGLHLMEHGEWINLP